MSPQISEVDKNKDGNTGLDPDAIGHRSRRICRKAKLRFQKKTNKLCGSEREEREHVGVGVNALCCQKHCRS
jgi:hypothetical protein